MHFGGGAVLQSFLFLSDMQCQARVQLQVVGLTACN